MGQRTQIFLQRINKEGEIKNEFYHYQWGYGGAMYRALINLFLDIMDNHDELDYFSEDFDFFKQGKLFGYNDTQCFDGIEKVKDLETVEFINQLQKEGDNNNGYLVIRISQSKDASFDTPAFAFGFVDHVWSGGDEYDVKGRYLTWQEYASKHGYEFTDSRFRKFFEGFIEWSGIKELQVKEGLQEGEMS